MVWSFVYLAPRRVPELMVLAGGRRTPGRWRSWSSVTSWPPCAASTHGLGSRRALLAALSRLLPGPDGRSSWSHSRCGLDGTAAWWASAGPIQRRHAASHRSPSRCKPFAVQALRQHRRQHARSRLACGQPQTVTLRRVEPGRPPQPVQLDPDVPHRAGHANQPQPRQPRLRPPASIIAARLRHADGGARPAGLHPPAPPDRTPGGRADRGRVRPSGAGRAGSGDGVGGGVRWRETGASNRPDRMVGGGVSAAQG
jgi:hypothetical protein